METEELDFSDDISTSRNNVVRTLLDLIKPQRRALILTVLLNIIPTFLDTAVTLIRRAITDQAIIPGRVDLLYRYGFLLIGLTLAMNAAIFIVVLVVARAELKIEKDLRIRAFRHMQTLQLSYFSRTPVGWILSRITSDTTRISGTMSWGFFDASFALTYIAIILGIMAYLNWKLALVGFFMLPIQIYAGLEIRKRILKGQREARKQNSLMTAAFNENMTGIRVVKALLRETKNLADFKKITEKKRNAAFYASRWNAVLNPFTQFTLFTALSIVLWNSKTQFQIGGLTIGSIEAFVTFFTMLQWPIQELTRVYGEAQQAIASGERYLSLLDTKSAIVNREGAKPLQFLNQEIHFENVSFHYDDGDQSPVLKNVNVRFKPGEVIALVGSTGGGKTTLVNLLARFYEPTDGVITIGGTDYRDIDISTYHSKLGIVLQTPHLFSGTIRENIRYGKLDATDEEIAIAAAQAGADKFILSFPHGYDEEVGEGGGLLSVGQKQLISIARAILADPELFILDEATSSVDTLTEKLITNSLETLMSGRTSLIIAHRLSTIKRADRILVIENGEIVESGTHHELLRNRNRYFELYSQQFRLERENFFMGGQEKLSSSTKKLE